MRLRFLPSSSSCASWQPRGRRRSPLLLLYRFSQVLLLSLQLGVLILKGFEFLVHLQTQGLDATVDLARDPGNMSKSLRVILRSILFFWQYLLVKYVIRISGSQYSVRFCTTDYTVQCTYVTMAALNKKAWRADLLSLIQLILWRFHCGLR